MKKLLLLLSIAFFVSCSSDKKGGSGDSTSSASGSTGSEAPKIWDYSSDTDKMTSKTRYFASVNATNKLDFDSPYNGGSVASVTVRNQAKANEVILSIDKGQFVCDLTDGCPVNIRFDSDPAVKFTATEPSDGSSTTLFISPEKKFINHLKKAKKMIVQAEFYESGLKEMEFDVTGFKWAH